MEAKAIAKYVRMSPSKLKPVTDLVRGKDFDVNLSASLDGSCHRDSGSLDLL